MKPHNVFGWSRSMREVICRSAEAGDTVHADRPHGASSCTNSWCPWLHSPPAAWKQLQNRYRGMHGAPSHFKVVFPLSGWLFKQDNRSPMRFFS